MIVRKEYCFFIPELLFVLFCCLGCSSEEVLQPIDNVVIRTFSEKEDSIGRVNAVKKAHQLTDLQFMPKNQIEHNSGTFLPEKTYKGLIYSSVKEIESFVGTKVSFHTFMTAVNNPRSRIYSERVDAHPYHGINCKAYYGTVCSELVSYALGLNSPSFNSYDFEQSYLMCLLDDTTPENLKIADILWKEGHVAIITDIVSGNDGKVNKIEISEATSPCCRRYYVNRETFVEAVMSKFQRIYRYKEIGGNTEYSPFNEFVAVEDEKELPFVYNNDICVDKGDRSNYLEGENVILNILNTDATTIEVYKNDNLFITLNIDNIFDYPLENLIYGDYKARVIIDENRDLYSEYTYWKVVNVDIEYDKTTSRLFFKSSNAVPDYVISCNINGLTTPLSEGFYHVFSEEEVLQGNIAVPFDRLSSSYPYLKVLFKTEYGRIIQKPIKWTVFP